MFDKAIGARHLISGIRRRLRGQGVGAVLVRGAGSSFAVMALGAIMAFGTNMLLARVMGVTHYGIYIYVLTWINVLSLACKLGMDTSLLRFIAAYNAKQEWSLFRGILARSMLYVLSAGLVTASIAGFIVWLLYEHIGREQATTFWVALLILPVLALTGLRNAALRALKHIAQASLPDSFIRPLVIVILAGGAFLYTQQQLPASQVMAFNLVGAIVAFGFGTFWLLAALPRQLRQTSPVYKTSEWLRVSLPMFLMSGTSVILNKTDIIMLGAIVSAEQAGIYAVASRMAGLVIFGLTAVNAIVVPMISELYSTDKRQQLQRMITLAARGIFVFTLFGCIGLVVLGEYLLGLFGVDFVAGYMPMLILLGGQIVNSLAGSVGFLMTMTGHQNKAAKILIFSSIINVILNAVLIPSMGITGAALATAASTALWNFMMLSYVLRRLQFNPTIFSIGGQSVKT